LLVLPSCCTWISPFLLTEDGEWCRRTGLDNTRLQKGPGCQAQSWLRAIPQGTSASLAYPTICAMPACPALITIAWLAACLIELILFMHKHNW
jgi:hypothetical protein